MAQPGVLYSQNRGKWTLPQRTMREQCVQTGGKGRTSPHSRYRPKCPRSTERERNPRKLRCRSSERRNNCFKIERYFQFFFREDSSNGSFGGGDAESVAGYTEQNTGVFRVVPTWTLGNGAVFELGISGLVGEINSRRADLADETVAAYAVDVTYTRGPWKAFVEGAQTYGVINPQRYVSGGPSDRLTNILAGIQYTRGAVTYRCSYSNSIDGNPDAVQNMVVAGATVTLSKHVDLYLEYVVERVDEAEIAGQNGFFFHGFEYVINWHF